MVFVDTNYFLRFLIDDDPQQAEEAKKLFLEAARGNLELVTSTIVVFEIYWVFKSYYQKTKDEIIKILQKVLTMNFVSLDERDLLLQALDLFKAENLSLEDCYNLSFALNKKTKTFKTFDVKLAGVFSSEQETQWEEFEMSRSKKKTKKEKPNKLKDVN